MPRPRSNKSTRKGSRTSFGKRSDAEKSFRKKRSGPREDSSEPRMFSKPSGYRKSNAGNSFRSNSSFKRPDDSLTPIPRRTSDATGNNELKSTFRGGEKRSFKSGTDKSKSTFRPSESPKFKDSNPSFRKGGDFRKTDGFGAKPYGADRGKKPFYKDRNERAPGREKLRGEFKESANKATYPDADSGNNPDKKAFRNTERKSFVQSRVSVSDFKRPPKPSGEAKAQDKNEAKTKEDGIPQEGLSRLNKYIANSGVGSRRDADKLITMGLISVNGTVVTELGTKVKAGDVVRYEDRILKAEKPVYILLNKPKGFITTTDDPKERNTVMGLVAGACKERIYPVGRLDRNTTGLLLLTNDGDLADKLTHPSYKAKKIYKVDLDKPLTKNDFQKIVDGVRLEEGKAMVDDLAIISEDNKTIGLEIHIGWNRVVRRIFESLGYAVLKLDRSVYAGLDKKDTPRGNWRFLKPEEIVMLKHFK